MRNDLPQRRRLAALASGRSIHDWRRTEKLKHLIQLEPLEVARWEGANCRRGSNELAVVDALDHLLALHFTLEQTPNGLHQPAGPIYLLKQQDRAFSVNQIGRKAL
jgi:hypothetical protein